eukprot:5513315-Karenia_brevis.AAC.1
MHEVVDKAEREDVHIRITIPKDTTYRDAQMIVHQRMVLELKRLEMDAIDGFIKMSAPNQTRTKFQENFTVAKE